MSSIGIILTVLFIFVLIVGGIGLFVNYVIKNGIDDRKTVGTKEEELSKSAIRASVENLMSLESFVKALAAFLMTQKEEQYPEILQGMASSILFSRAKPVHTLTILQVLVKSNLFKQEIALQREMSGLSSLNSTLQKSQTDLLLNVHQTASHLIGTRNALAKVLQEYGAPRIWQLNGQFLAGANLRGLSLESADFRNAFLIGTNLKRSNLSETNFEDAVLIYAQLTEANLAGALLTHANLTNAKVTKAEMTAADLTSAKVAWSTLYLAKNVDKSWQYANFVGEKKRDSKLWRRMKAKFGTGDQ